MQATTNRIQIPNQGFGLIWFLHANSVCKMLLLRKEVYPQLKSFNRNRNLFVQNNIDFGEFFTFKIHYVRFLMKFGIYVDIMIYDDCSLFTALVKKKYSLAKFLIRKKIGIKYIKPQINETTLIIAAAQKYEDLALKIVKLGCDIKVVNNASSNALNIAISRDLFKLTKKLIELGCDVNFVESDKRTCLNCCRSVKMAKIIYEHGCRSFKYNDMNLDVKKFLVSVDPQIVINSLFETYEQDPEILNKIVSFKPQISDLKPQWFAEI